MTRKITIPMGGTGGAATLTAGGGTRGIRGTGGGTGARGEIRFEWF